MGLVLRIKNDNVKLLLVVGIFFAILSTCATGIIYVQKEQKQTYNREITTPCLSTLYDAEVAAYKECNREAIDVWTRRSTKCLTDDDKLGNSVYIRFKCKENNENQ